MMSTPKDSKHSSGWRAELDPLPEASELEFLRWFYQNTDDVSRDQLRNRYVQEQHKAPPSIGLI